MMNAGTDYGVRVICAYEQRRVGQVFFPPGLLRDALLRRGFVERVLPPTDLLDDAGDTENRGRRKRGLAR